MRTSSEGTQARLEGESHSREGHVAEADTVRRSMSNPRTPIIIKLPTVTNEVVMRLARTKFSLKPCPQLESAFSSQYGLAGSLQLGELVSSVVRHVKGSEGHLSQRINCYASNAGTGCGSLRGRRAGRQCRRRGSKAVVVGGVTTTQGGRESRPQGEGLGRRQTA